MHASTDIVHVCARRDGLHWWCRAWPPTAAAVYPQIVQIDPARGSVDKARNDALSAILKVQNIRTEHGSPPTCR
jgi:hypothetical protein